MLLPIHLTEVYYWLHCALSLAVQCIVIGPVCGFVCVCVHLLPRQLEIACIDLNQTESVGEGSDHLHLIKFWSSCTPGKGSMAERNFLVPPYYRRRTVFASSERF